MEDERWSGARGMMRLAVDDADDANNEDDDDDDEGNDAGFADD